jgi:chemotaxis protein methyltransferase CheR
MSPILDRRDVEAFRDIIPGLLGLHFDDTRLEDVAAALRRRLSATRSDVASYLRRLRGPEGRLEVRPLAELLTVCETYFLRNSEQLRAFVEVAVPERVRLRSQQRTLRILSAGCSSGEEPYSLAMALREAAPDLVGTWDIRITGIDVNRARLERGRAGRYGPWSLREVPGAIQARWFRRNGGELVLDDGIRRAVRLEERNLLDEDPAFWQQGTYDVVFFRNVLMYFPLEVARAVISRIARALAPGGFLFLGHAENLRAVSNEFHLRHSHECFYYQLRGPADEAGALAREEWDAGAVAARAVDGEASWVDAIRRASERIAELEACPGAAPSGPAPPVRRAATTTPPGRSLSAAIELMQQERMAEAVAALPSQAASDADALLLRAVLLTSCGRIGDAETVCSKLLEHDDLNSGAHYVAALCREHAGDRKGARHHDETAAYLDPGFAMPRLHLGLLARRSGDQEVARNELRQAEILLEREDASRILLFGGGFRREGLLALCRAELRACGVPQ